MTDNAFSVSLLLAVREKLPLVEFSRRETLVRYLTFVYHLIQASENILRVAGFEARLTPDAELLECYTTDHLREERDHAAWLEEDLEGEPLHVIDTYATACAGSVYYLVQHVSPWALLGYLVVLECTPPPLAFVETMERLHGPDLLRTFRYHAENDPQHGLDVLCLIDEAPTMWQPLIASTALHTVEYLSRAAATFNV